MDRTEFTLHLHPNGPPSGENTGPYAPVWRFVLGAALLLFLGTVLVPMPGGARTLLGHVTLTLLPLAAAAGTALAAWRAPSDARVPWLLLCAGSLAALAGQTIWSAGVLGVGATGPPPGYVHLLFLLFHPLFAAGVAYAMRSERYSSAVADVILDGTLILLVATVVILRLVVEPLLAADAPPERFYLMLAVQVAATGSLFFASVLLLWRSSVIAPRAVVALFGAAAAFLVGNIASAAGVDPAPGRPGDWFDGIWVVGWGAMVWAGVVGADVGSTRAQLRAADRAQDLLRRSVAPGAALFLVAAVVDAAVRPMPQPQTVVAIGLLGLVLALRTEQALRRADWRTEERRVLGHTRAMVEVSHALAGATDLDTTLKRITVATCRVLGTRGAGIELLTEDGAMLETRAAAGLPQSMLGARFPLDGSFTGWVVRHGEPRATIDPAADPFIQPQSLSALGRSPAAAAPLRYGERTFGVLFACIRDRPFDAEELEVLAALAEQAAIAIENARLFEQVTAMSLTDPLTGLANRRQLERDLAREFAAAQRGRRLVAVLFDLDRFKEYNDQHGHLAGDRVLKTFAEALRSETRTMNLAARYGGDEFVALLSDSDMDGAEIFVERIRERLAEGMKDEDDYHGVSAGIAEYEADMESWTDLIDAADKSLYRIKTHR